MKRVGGDAAKFRPALAIAAPNKQRGGRKKTESVKKRKENNEDE